MMAEMTVKLTWDEEELCEGWMNEGNLELLLYSSQKTRRDLLKVEILEEKDNADQT